MKNNQLVQIGNLNSLMMGDYYGSCKVKDLLRFGDTGIGTYAGLDGEAIIINGKAYNGRATGVVSEMQADDYLPFSTVAKFNNEVNENHLEFTSIEDFKTKMEQYLQSHNFFYMIKMAGNFNVRVRSCFVQNEPYEPLYKVACDQREFEYHDEEGFVVGLYCPNYVNGMNLPGWHIHFISKDLTKGGHILKLSSKSCVMKINCLDEWDVLLPHTSGFEKWDLATDLKDKTNAVEGSMH